MLGHPYLFIGTVLHGKAHGRTVGMPTANLAYLPYKQLPAHGVYGTRAVVGGTAYQGLTNIGRRPSDDDYDYVSIETFLLDFDRDIFGSEFSLEICSYVRGVMKFNNLAEVKRQVDRDILSLRRG